MGECLREIADEPPAQRVLFLAQQPECKVVMEDHGFY